jgi:DNA-binding MurR/RpiR family transcriptional regulator
MRVNALTDLLEPGRTDLTQVERRLVDVLLASPNDAMFMSVRELAAKAGAHESSAVRLARKLGFDGYPALRRALQQRSLAQSPASTARRMARSIADADDGDVLGALLAKELAALHGVAEHLNQRQIEAAARKLAAARRIFVWAQGNARILAEMTTSRLASAGFDARNISVQGRDLAERLLALSKGDVVLAFAFRRVPKALPVLMQHADTVGAATVLVADMVGHRLADPPGILLAAPRGEDASFLTLSVPMLIANALVLTLGRVAQDRTISALQSLDELRRELGNDD